MRIFHRATALSALCLVTAAAWAEETKPAAPAAAAAAPTAASSAMSNEEKAIYALGLALWRNVKPFDLSPAEIEVFQRGLADAASGATPVVTLEEARPMLEALQKSRLQRRLEEERAAGKAYADKAAAEPGAIRTESGLVFRETVAGTGETPTPADQVKVNYRGRLLDGTEFDSSYKNNQPAQFALSRVVKCLSEALQLMKAGGKATIVCPAELAYGDRGRPSIPPGATLVFEIEVLEVVVNSAAPKADASKPESE